MRYRLGVGIAIGTAVMASAWSGRAADLDDALLRATPSTAKPVTTKPADLDLGLATLYRRRAPAASPPIWESRTLVDDGHRLATSEASVDITPADRAAIFAQQRRASAPRR